MVGTSNLGSWDGQWYNPLIKKKQLGTPGGRSSCWLCQVKNSKPAVGSFWENDGRNWKIPSCWWKIPSCWWKIPSCWWKIPSLFMFFHVVCVQISSCSIAQFDDSLDDSSEKIGGFKREWSNFPLPSLVISMFCLSLFCGGKLSTNWSTREVFQQAKLGFLRGYLKPWWTAVWAQIHQGFQSQMVSSRGAQVKMVQVLSQFHLVHL